MAFSATFSYYNVIMHRITGHIIQRQWLDPIEPKVIFLYKIILDFLFSFHISLICCDHYCVIINLYTNDFTCYAIVSPAILAFGGWTLMRFEVVNCSVMTWFYLTLSMVLCFQSIDACFKILCLFNYVHASTIVGMFSCCMVARGCCFIAWFVWVVQHDARDSFFDLSLIN